MNSYWSTSILLLSFFSTFAQYDVTDSISSPVISLNQMNVVYIGIENPFRVAVPGYSSDQIELKVRGGEIKKEDNIYYLIVRDTRGKVREAFVSVYIRVNDSLNFVDEKAFRIKRIPVPTPYFGSKSGGEISAEEAQLVNFIRYSYDDCYFDLKISVTHYHFIYHAVNGVLYAESVNSQILTPTIKEKLKQVNKGDILIFTNIYAFTPGISYNQLPGAIVFTIK